MRRKLQAAVCYGGGHVTQSRICRRLHRGYGFFAAASVPAAQFGTAEEAKALLERAVAAVKEDEAKAIDMFNKGEGGFKDRDLYVWCANASDGVLTAHPRIRARS